MPVSMISCCFSRYLFSKSPEHDVKLLLFEKEGDINNKTKTVDAANTTNVSSLRN